MTHSFGNTGFLADSRGVQKSSAGKIKSHRSTEADCPHILIKKGMRVIFMAKVVIDAGHGGTTDPGAVNEGRREADDNLALALAVGDLLKKDGVDVVFTRTEDVYQTPFEKAQISNRENPDFLISFHRNSSPEQNQYSGVETLVFDRSGDKVRMAEAINRNLEEAGFRNLGIEERPGLVILRKSTAPALLVEAGFMNTDADNQLFDERFEVIAQAAADGILEVLLEEDRTEHEVGSSEAGGTEHETELLYRVQTGAFRKREYAQDMLYQLQEQGYPAFLLQEGDLYKVQVGAFRELENAIKMEASLRSRGYSTYITV